MGTFEHLAFHEPLVARLGNTWQRIFARAIDRFANLRGTGTAELIQVLMSRAELRNLRSLTRSPWEDFLYFHVDVDVHLQLAHSWLRQDQRDADTAKTLLSQLLEELEAASARSDSDPLDLDLPLELEVRAEQELLFLESEALLALLDLQPRFFWMEWEPKVLGVRSRLQSILDSLKARDWPNDQRVSWLVSLDDAAPLRLIQELNLVAAKDPEFRDDDKMRVANTVLLRIYGWLGGDLAASRPCRHGRTNLRVAEGLTREGKGREAARLLQSFVETEAHLLNPQRVLATIREQRAARKLLKELPT